jgi:hypothetical protein
LLISVTLEAGCVSAGGQSGLLELKTAVRVVTVTALHRSFENFVMERQIELVLRFGVATNAELRLAGLEQPKRCESGLLRIGLTYENV